MIRDRDMMLATLLGREAHLAAGFARHRVTEAMECAHEVTPRQIEGQPHAGRACGALRRDDFIVHAMEPDHLRPLGVPLIVVTPYRFADHHAQLVQVIRLGDDRGADSVGNVSAFRSILDDKQDFGHR